MLINTYNINESCIIQFSLLLHFSSNSLSSIHSYNTRSDLIIPLNCFSNHFKHDFFFSFFFKSRKKISSSTYASFISLKGISIINDAFQLFLFFKMLRWKKRGSGKKREHCWMDVLLTLCEEMGGTFDCQMMWFFKEFF